jgi:hypothetical protein
MCFNSTSSPPAESKPGVNDNSGSAPSGALSPNDHALEVLHVVFRAGALSDGNGIGRIGPDECPCGFL